MGHVNISIQRVTDSRLSAHHDTVKRLMIQFPKLNAACVILYDSKEVIDTRGSVQVLLLNICIFFFLWYLYFWGHVLEEVYITQKNIQTSGLSLENCLVSTG